MYISNVYSCSRALIPPQGEFAHRIVKRLFALTNKKDAVTQIATKYRREARSSEAKASRVDHQLDVEDSEVVAPELHHHISHSRNSPLKLRNFLRCNPEDPAKKVSSPRCKAGINPNKKLEGLPPQTSSTSSRADARPGLRYGVP